MPPKLINAAMQSRSFLNPINYSFSVRFVKFVRIILGINTIKLSSNTVVKRNYIMFLWPA